MLIEAVVLCSHDKSRDSAGLTNRRGSHNPYLINEIQQSAGMGSGLAEVLFSRGLFFKFLFEQVDQFFQGGVFGAGEHCS